MKKALIILMVLFNFAYLAAQAQYDSIYTSNEGVIAASIKEITTDAVKFSYPNEDLVNSMIKNKIQKIVFKSGRVQVFSEATSYKKVTCVEDWENVSLSRLESELQGLYKIGDISVKAKGSGLESSSKVNDRAYRKLKMEAALQGANIVYVASETSVGNKMGTAYQAGQAAETQLSGITYTSTLPKYSDFVKATQGKNTFLIKKDELGNNSSSFSSDSYSNIATPIANPQEKGSFIYVTSTIKGADATEFRVTYFDAGKLILTEEYKGKVKNYTLLIQ
jgi:hypothetical protein